MSGPQPPSPEIQARSNLVDAAFKALRPCECAMTVEESNHWYRLANATVEAVLGVLGDPLVIIERAIPTYLPPEQEDLVLQYGAGRLGADPCPVPDCPISAQEHHRLARGVMAENTELRRANAQLRERAVSTPDAS